MHNFSLVHTTFPYITVPHSYNLLRCPTHYMLSFGRLLQSHILLAGAKGQSQACRQLVCLTFVPPLSHPLYVGYQKQQPGCTQHPPSLPWHTAIKQSRVYSNMTHYLIKNTTSPFQGTDDVMSYYKRPVYSYSVNAHALLAKISKKLVQNTFIVLVKKLLNLNVSFLHCLL